MKQIVNTKIRRIILKRKIYQFIDEWVTGENISAILLFIILVICVSLKRNIDKLKPTDIVDFSLIISFIILFLSKLVSNALLKPIRRVCEDAAKLSNNYEELAKKYTLSNLITIRNDFDKKENSNNDTRNCLLVELIRAIKKLAEAYDIKFMDFDKKKNSNNDTRNCLPVELICARKKSEEAYDIKFTDSLIQYELPNQIANISAHLFKVHRESDKYNSRCFRLDKITKIDNQINMRISRTSFYDSLLTNRAMDYIWPDGRSNRDVYEPGPYISSLEDSKMSNHIGINGIIETKDEKFIFVKQDGKNSIGKNTIGTSIGTVLKAEYILKRDGSLVEGAVVKAIQEEIKEKLEINDIEIKKDNIVAIYRDLVEGGKPQILFYKKLKKEKEKDPGNNSEKIISIKKDVVMNGIFKKSGISTSEGYYSMMPSVVASIVLIKYHLEKIELPTRNPNNVTS